MTAQVSDPYASRLDSETIADRHDPVLWGAGDGPLSDESMRAYGRHGCAAAQLLDPDEVEELRAEATRLAERADVEQDEVIAERGSGAIRSIFRVHEASDAIRALCKDERLTDVARQILGSDVYVHQSRLNYKPGFDGREFYWHSDFETWHMEDGMPRMRALSVSIALTDNSVSNGPLLIIPGSHMKYVRCAGATPVDHFRDSLTRQEYGVPSRQAVRELSAGPGQIDACIGPEGSATFFDCNTMHGSAGSISPYARTNLFLVFNSLENLLERPFCGRDPRPTFLAERRPVAVDRL